MNVELLKANLNLYAVLTNLEDLVAHDPETHEKAKGWHISIQFVVHGGPKAYVAFDKGVCTVGRGLHHHPKVVLVFTSPAHLNKMFASTANPIPVWGFTKLGFLTKDFTALTKRLEYFLKPTDALLKDPGYLALNTRFTLNTAAFAVPEIVKLDPVGQAAAAHLHKGVVVMKVLPEGPGVYLALHQGRIEAHKGLYDRPTSAMLMKDQATANAFLNGKSDTFTAVASGEVSIKGQLPLLDALSLVLDRVPHYLS
jgi:hypothetical protein